MTEEDFRVILDVLLSWEALVALGAFLLFIVIVRYVAVGKADRPRYSRQTIVRRIGGGEEHDVQPSLSAKPAASSGRGIFRFGRGRQKEAGGEAAEGVESRNEGAADETPSFQD